MRYLAILAVSLVLLTLTADHVHAQEPPRPGFQDAPLVPIPGAIILAPGERARFRYPDTDPPWMLPGDPRPLPRPGRGVDVINASDTTLDLVAEPVGEGYVLTIAAPSGHRVVVRLPGAPTPALRCANVEVQPEMAQCIISLTPPPIIWVITTEPVVLCPLEPDSQ